MKGSAADSNLSIDGVRGKGRFNPLTQPGIALTTQQAQKLGVKVGGTVDVRDKVTGKVVQATYYDSAGSRRGGDHFEVSPKLADELGIKYRNGAGKVVDAVTNTEKLSGRFTIESATSRRGTSSFDRSSTASTASTATQTYRAAPSLADVTAGRAELKPYDKGAAVEELQRRLGVTVDGKLGPVTLAALEAAKAKAGLSGQSGRAGKTTMAKLLSSDATTSGTTASSSVTSTTGQSQMNALLKKAKAASTGKRPDGKCLMHVQNYLDQMGSNTYGKGSKVARLPYAKNFGQEVNKDPARYGLKKLNITNPYDAPAGAIVVVNPGTPGTRHKVAGDITVAGGNGKFYNGGEMGYGGRKNFPAGNSHVVGTYVPV